MKRLRARPELAALLPDVEIFYRAVDGAFRYGEFFAEDDIAKARAAAGHRARAGQGAGQRQDPLAGAARPDRARLRVDARRIGAALRPVPARAAGRPRGGRRWRLDTWFHGRGEKLSEVNFISRVSRAGRASSSGPTPSLLQPYGRYCNGSKLAGEVDFFEALADVKRRFPIDEDRIVIRGFSLGGHSAWHLGAHFASRLGGGGPGRRLLRVARSS